MVLNQTQDAHKLVSQWRDAMERAMGFDSWGQMLEASEEYEKLFKSVKHAVSLEDGTFNDDRVRFLNKMILVVSCRAVAAQDLSGETNGIRLEHIRKIAPALVRLLDSLVPEFPVSVAGLRRPAILDEPVASSSVGYDFDLLFMRSLRRRCLFTRNMPFS